MAPSRSELEELRAIPLRVEESPTGPRSRPSALNIHVAELPRPLWYGGPRLEEVRQTLATPGPVEFAIERVGRGEFRSPQVWELRTPSRVIVSYEETRTDHEGWKPMGFFLVTVACGASVLYGWWGWDWLPWRWRRGSTH
jgi:hypothetical protein